MMVGGSLCVDKKLNKQAKLILEISFVKLTLPLGHEKFLVAKEEHLESLKNIKGDPCLKTLFIQ